MSEPEQDILNQEEAQTIYEHSSIQPNEEEPAPIQESKPVLPKPKPKIETTRRTKVDIDLPRKTRSRPSTIFSNIDRKSRPSRDIKSSCLRSREKPNYAKYDDRDYEVYMNTPLTEDEMRPILSKFSKEQLAGMCYKKGVFPEITKMKKADIVQITMSIPQTRASFGEFILGAITY